MVFDQWKEENKLIVCRTAGRPLIFPNVIEGVYTYLEKQEKKRKLESIGEKGEEWMNEAGEKRGVKKEKRKKLDNAVTIQDGEGEWTTPVFRGYFIGWFPWGGNSV